MKFSVMLFSGAMAATAEAQYAYALRIAQAADVGGLEGVWVPERHFTGFGAPFPNPLLLLAGLASVTRRLRLRAGSVVAPLHHPLRLAEDLSMLAQLSGGRAEAALASGWHPDDFVFRPEAYEDRRSQTFRVGSQMRAAWAGEDVPAINGAGEPVRVRVEPRLAGEAPRLWITAAQTRETFEEAGRQGYDLLTHLLDPNLALLGDNIAAYRTAREAAGLVPGEGRVALMLHTFLDDDAEAAVEQVRAPYTSYLRSIAPMAGGLATARARSVQMGRLTPQQIDQFVAFQFQRTVQGRALIGSPRNVQSTIVAMAALGVDEIACLIDFGLPGEVILRHLDHLIDLARASDPARALAPA